MPAGRKTRSGSVALALVAVGLVVTALAVERRARPAASDALALLRFGTLPGTAITVVRHDGAVATVRRLESPRDLDCRVRHGVDLLGPGAAPFVCLVRVADDTGCDAFAAFTAEPRSVLVPPLGGWFYGTWPAPQARAELRRRGRVGPGVPCRADGAPS